MPASCDLALKAMYCSAKAFASRAASCGSAGGGDDVQDVGVRRRFDLDFAEQFAGDVARCELLAHALRHFRRVGDQHFGVGFTLGFAAAGSGDLQGGSPTACRSGRRRLRSPCSYLGVRSCLRTATGAQAAHHGGDEQPPASHDRDRACERVALGSRLSRTAHAATSNGSDDVISNHRIASAALITCLIVVPTPALEPGVAPARRPIGPDPAAGPAPGLGTSSGIALGFFAETVAIPVPAATHPTRWAGRSWRAFSRAPPGVPEAVPDRRSGRSPHLSRSSSRAHRATGIARENTCSTKWHMQLHARRGRSSRAHVVALPDKGTPVVRRARKARGLSQTAQPPKE